MDLQDQEHTAGGRRGGLLGRAFQQAKRIGEIVNPDAVANAEQAWKELAPDLRQAADDLLRSKEEILFAGTEARDIWSAAKEAWSGFGAVETDRTAADSSATFAQEREEGGSVTVGWEGLKKDIERAAQGVFGDVFGEAADEVLASFETRLSEALSEGNVRAASQLWRRLLDTPGVQLLAQDRRLWAGAEKAVRRYLSGFLSEKSAKEAQRAVNATADFALHFAGLSRNAAKSDHEVFEELSHKLCHLQGAAEKLWPLAVLALPLLGYQDYAKKLESAIRSNALSRVTQTVSATVLLGLNPRDPFLLTLIASFSLGHLSKDVAQNMAAFFQKVLVDQVRFDQPQTKQSLSDAEGAPLLSPVDLATELVTGTKTCQELGHQAFAFFKVVQRALEGSSPSFVVESVDVNDNGVHPSTEASTALQEGRPPPQPLQQRGPRRTPRKLKLEGIVLRQAIWVAAVIDSKYFSLEVLVVCLVVGCVLVFGSIWVCCWRGLRDKRGRPRMIKKGRGGVQLYQAPRPALAARREKTA
ncbi:unnamed protein product [Ectocarpus sp. CCAP 1310/34]|nr:unnamed protein product [Ectocarpus sp. CCAP 1310/34]